MTKIVWVTRDTNVFTYDDATDTMTVVPHMYEAMGDEQFQVGLGFPLPDNKFLIRVQWLNIFGESPPPSGYRVGTVVSLDPPGREPDTFWTAPETHGKAHEYTDGYYDADYTSGITHEGVAYVLYQFHGDRLPDNTYRTYTWLLNAFDPATGQRIEGFAEAAAAYYGMTGPWAQVGPSEVDDNTSGQPIGGIIPHDGWLYFCIGYWAIIRVNPTTGAWQSVWTSATVALPFVGIVDGQLMCLDYNAGQMLFYNLDASIPWVDALGPPNLDYLPAPASSVPIPAHWPQYPNPDSVRTYADGIYYTWADDTTQGFDLYRWVAGTEEKVCSVPYREFYADGTVYDPSTAPVGTSSDYSVDRYNVCSLHLLPDAPPPMVPTVPVLGWWDGQAIQPIPGFSLTELPLDDAAYGWWDGAKIVPLGKFPEGPA